MFKKYQSHVLTLSICVLVLIILSRNITRPFYGHHEFNGVFYGQIARNYIRYGLIKTELAQITTTADTPVHQWGTHTHHPPTYPLLLAAMYRVFGSYEWVSRAISIIATLISIMLLSLFAYKYTKNPLIPLIVLPLIVSPLFLYYARMPVFEPLLLSLSLWLYWAYDKKKFKQIFISSLLLILLDWPGYWPVMTLLLYEVFAQKKYTPSVSSTIGALVIGTICILTVQWISYGNPINDLLAVGLFRFTGSPFTSSEWIRLLISRSKAFIGLPLLITVIGGGLFSLKNRNNPLFTFIVISFVSGIAHIFVFRNITWYHDYMLYHLIPLIFFCLIILFVYLSKHRFSGSVIIIMFAVVAFLNWQQTHAFADALTSLNPHRDCYEIALKAKSEQNSTTYPVSQEKANECPPFLNFYADKKVNLEVK